MAADGWTLIILKIDKQRERIRHIFGFSVKLNIRLRFTNETTGLGNDCHCLLKPLGEWLMGKSTKDGSS